MRSCQPCCQPSLQDVYKRQLLAHVDDPLGGDAGEQRAHVGVVVARAGDDDRHDAVVVQKFKVRVVEPRGVFDRVARVEVVVEEHDDGLLALSLIHI